ncbi:ribonuclease J [Metabacillus arenae]|uniref:Ribonuclease J n=1 Tax=Metabacillus arenae TaxID=2771434 RepID=A0A926RV36_9BACI|nr:ribonuclease J [Metabacillus arenae]MBD1379263.1 ribonuclease J [Metabacillus arenae]
MTEKETEKIKIFALGGVGEIGKNLYVIEVNSDIFIVDAGIMYPENEMFGIDMVIPDITYLVENANRIKAIFLTHGHDENIGGVFYLLQKLSAPIYGSALTLALLQEKLKMQQTDVKADFRKVHSKSVLRFGHVKISFFYTIHSIPDSLGICFHTSQGAIVHSGDFKFDQTPVQNSFADIGEMAKIGSSGVLCLLSDSTNAEKLGHSGSEAIVGKEISDAMYQAEGRVLVTVFATNLFRVQEVIDAAAQNNRKLAIVGKNMIRIVKLAVQLGYLTVPEDILIPLQEISNYSSENVVILTTGRHGEPLGALEKMARQTHRYISVDKGDTVLVAASPMPGQELIFSKTIDLIYRTGANVVFKERQIHVSGHGYQEELKLMLNIMKPKYLIPINGEYKMQIAHAKLARMTGMEEDNIFLIEKGEMIELTNKEGKLSGQVQTGNVLVDGLGVGDVGNIVLRDRKLLSKDGILIIVLTISKAEKLMVAGPEIITRGFVYVRESEKLIEKAAALVADRVENCLNNSVVEWSTIKNNVREGLSHYLFEQTKRRPMILPIIMEI